MGWVIDEMESRWPGKQVLFQKWEFQSRTAGKRETCMYCERKKKWEKGKGKSHHLTCGIFPKKKLMKYSVDGQWWQLEGVTGMALSTEVKRRDGSEEAEELMEEGSEFVNISKTDRYGSQPNKSIFTVLSVKTKILILTQTENSKLCNRVLNTAFLG